MLQVILNEWVESTEEGQRENILPLQNVEISAGNEARLSDCANIVGVPYLQEALILFIWRRLQF